MKSHNDEHFPVFNRKNNLTRDVMMGLALACALFTAQAIAQEQYAFQSEQQSQAFQELVKEIRCLTCPNQNIAESEGGLALAIKEEIYTQLEMGEEPEAIRQSLIERYGEQILYRPTMSERNWVLWWGPLALFLVGFVFWWKSLRSHVH